MTLRYPILDTNGKNLVNIMKENLKKTKKMEMVLKNQENMNIGVILVIIKNVEKVKYIIIN